MQDENKEPHSVERQSFLKLTRELASLPLEQSAAALETSAAIAGVSLRAGIEFLRAAPDAADVLPAAELRSWGEMGRRIAMSDVETAVTFFGEGVSELGTVPQSVLPSVFQLCSRQITLSVPVAVDTLRGLPVLASAVPGEVLGRILDVAGEISRRSAKHSAEFLSHTPQVVASLSLFRTADVRDRGIDLAAEFAARAGGIAADAWAALPPAIAGLTHANTLRLINESIRFLERGGGSALQVLNTGGEILRNLPEIFSDWIELLWVVAQHGNASLIAFVRSSPRFVQGLASDVDHRRRVDLARRVIVLTKEIAAVDGEAALACFRSSATALRVVDIAQFEEWGRQGLSLSSKDARARRSYFALETRSSYDALRGGVNGLALEDVRHLLQLYIEGLTGREVEISPLSAVPVETRIGDGRTIHLPSAVAEFGEDGLDFRLYKVLAAHAAGQIEFGTYEQGTRELQAAFATLAETYSAENSAALAAFAVPDEMVGQTFLSDPDSEKSGNEGTGRNACPTDVDYRRVLHLFPNTQLARRVFGTLENCRIDRHLRRRYRGLARDLDLIREHLRRSRPSVLELPSALLPFELLFQTSLLGGATDEARQYYGQIVSELEIVIAEYLSSPMTTVADSLMATSRVYALFQNVTPNNDSVQELETQPEASEAQTENSIQTESYQRRQSDTTPPRRDARELFNSWNDPNQEAEPEELAGAEAWTEADTPEQMIEEGEVAFNYDEWDRELTDHRLGWCRVVEKRVKHGDRAFVEETRERHRGVISSIRHQFQMMKPEDLTRVTNELDGEEFDLNAVVDYVIDRRAARTRGLAQQSERLYTQRLRRRRDVAVSFLLDQSSSTARTIGRHPLQPYTRPGRRIIEIEKEGLVLMSEALEAVGDIYSINGFTSEGRRNVKFYVVKDFDEKYSDEVKQRIGGITFQNNTRLGAAIRHATARLGKQQARTRLLIVLSDGRPYDHDYGDARYAREDTREALRQAKNAGVTPFCITIDRESEAELRDLYGDIGYTIIDDVLSLPERLPGIYRRLTT
ncbi:MAG TPA: VWA domain-containing protein [Pyrinomonadaceae bacterium]|nr:VWA domain-containing protein [Pyrinomonadaceae bacterium]